jgi:hypothetical protein
MTGVAQYLQSTASTGVDDWFRLVRTCGRDYRARSVIRK